MATTVNGDRKYERRDSCKDTNYKLGSRNSLKGRPKIFWLHPSSIKYHLEANYDVEDHNLETNGRSLRLISYYLSFLFLVIPNWTLNGRCPFPDRNAGLVYLYPSLLRHFLMAIGIKFRRSFSVITPTDKFVTNW